MGGLGCMDEVDGAAVVGAGGGGGGAKNV